MDLEGTATLLGSINVHTGQAIGAESSGPEVVTLNSVYSNVTTFTGSVVTNGGSANQAGNNITTMIADDLDMTAAANIIGFRFSVGNLNTTAVSARPRVRFYADNAGVPGTYLGGFSFNAISFPANSVNVLGTTIAPFPMPANIWAGMVFDNNTGATGATLAQLDLLGQGSFDPVDVGSSTDNLFGTTAAGSFNVNDPVGVTFNFGANPVANVGWELVSVPEPTMLSVIGAVASFVLARRRA
ncbi:MAG TPA: PEP-CTERM sorting domain-containing protein [Tepidisphaeraceae bacterium]|nr:PEP-CTERM sorting domain-containing protein [Tepidisphaeraceae bacterium]